MPGVGGSGREHAAGALLHNMSAPPRMKVTLNPIPATPPIGGSGETTADVLPQGLSLVARVNLGPFRARVDRNYKGLYEYTAWELARLILITRLARGLPHQGMTSLKYRGHEYLKDELAKGLGAIDVPRPDLPAFAVVCKGQPDPSCGMPCETDPARALALVARVTGCVYVGRREPRVASLLQRAEEYRFYAAAETPGGKDQA